MTFYNHTTTTRQLVFNGDGLNAGRDAARPLQSVPRDFKSGSDCGVGRPMQMMNPPVMKGRIILHPVWTSARCARVQIHRRPVAEAHNRLRLNCASGAMPKPQPAVIGIPKHSVFSGQPPEVAA